MPIFDLLLAGRVIYLPYKFEDILPTLNSYLVSLQYALVLEEQTKAREYKGEAPAIVSRLWGTVLRTYVFHEYVDKIPETYSKVDWSKEEFGNALEAHFNIFLSYLAVDDKSSLDYWSKRLDQYLTAISTNNLVIAFDNAYRLSFKVNESSLIQLSVLTSSLLNVLKVAQQKSKVPNKDVANHVKRIHSKLETFYDHISLLQSGLSLLDYVKISGSQWESRDLTIDEIKARILELERKKLESIYCGSKLDIS